MGLALHKEIEWYVLSLRLPKRRIVLRHDDYGALFQKQLALFLCQ